MEVEESIGTSGGKTLNYSVQSVDELNATGAP